MSKKVNELMEEIEEETVYISKDGEFITLREAIDSVLARDKKQKRVLGEG